MIKNDFAMAREAQLGIFYGLWYRFLTEQSCENWSENFDITQQTPQFNFRNTRDDGGEQTISN